VSIIKILPSLHAPGAAQMALDAGLLQTADDVFVRRYTWERPALSLGRFQRVELPPRLPFDVVARPSGGRAVVHGEDFEWSFAIVFPPGSFDTGATAGIDVASPYEVVTSAFGGALEELGVVLDGPREGAYERSPFCFGSMLRHDLLTRGEKIVAFAQARSNNRVLVHGSVLERRPPRELTDAAEVVLGASWTGEGLAGAGLALVRETLWKGVLTRLETELQRLREELT
jgi:lipoate-protein ligase A